MNVLLITLSALIFISLILITAAKPTSSSLSRYELRRRVNLGDDKAIVELDRENTLIDVISLQKILVSLLLVIFVLTSVTTFGWAWGVLLAMFVALEYGAIARLSIFSSLSENIYNKYESRIIALIKKVPYLFKILRSVSIGENNSDSRIDSREELQHLVGESVGVLSTEEKKLIIHSLSFGDKLVDSIMTPRSVIDSIRNTEFLGPLVLNDLHKTGHSRLPVINGDIDHVVGILNLKSLLALDIKSSTTAEKAMDPKVYYIRQDQTLQHALAAFLRTHHHLFIVVNEFRETVGLLSLEDVIEALLGRKIIDEFDSHDDLRSVALRNPRGNNHPEKKEDV